MKFAGFYALAMGVMMFLQWGFFIASGQVPELQTEPYRIAFHLAAEGLTALGLVVSGLALLRKKGWAPVGFLFFSGMVCYSMIVSPGYFAQQGQWAFVVMFAVLLCLMLYATRQVLLQYKQER